MRRMQETRLISITLASTRQATLSIPKLFLENVIANGFLVRHKRL